MEFSPVEMSCAQVRRHLVDYMEGDLEDAMARSLISHVDGCRQCGSVLKGLHNVVGLLGDLAGFELPADSPIWPGSSDGPTGSGHLG